MNLKSMFSKQNRTSSILTMVYFVFGLMFCILPSIMMETFEVIVCAVLLLYGTIILFANCVSSVVSTNRKLMFTAVLAVIVGVFLLFVRSFFILVMALCILAFAIFKILVLRKIRNAKNINWYVWLIITIIHFLVAIFAIIFFALNKFLIISMVLVGVSLILESLGNVFVFIRNQKVEEVQAFNSETDENKSEQ